MTTAPEPDRPQDPDREPGADDAAPDGPMTGIRIVDLGQVLAAPFATHLLAGLGAEVIKVEPPEGEWLRRAGGPLAFAPQNCGKRMAAIDVATTEGRDAVLRLAASADVFVEGFAPGTAEALGLGSDAVRATNDRLVYASLSAFGADGPYGGRLAFDHVVQAVSGIMDSTGFPDQPPVKVGSPYVDYSTGLLLAFAVLAGLRLRDRTGTGLTVDVTMLDAALLLNVGALVRTANTGIDPPRTGNDAFSGAVASGVFDTADGLLAIAANKVSHVIRLCDALGLPDLADDLGAAVGRGADPSAAERARRRIAQALAGADAEHWERRLAEARVPAGRVRRLSEVVDDGHPRARGLLQPVAADEHGHLEGDALRWLPGAGIRIDGSMPGPREAPGPCGADTDRVLADVGYDEARLAELRAGGVIG